MNNRNSLIDCAIRGLLPSARFAAVLAFAMVVVVSGQGQTYSVIHNFTGGGDGAQPMAGLTLDQAGNLYGTTSYGGRASCARPAGCGVVFRMQHRGSGWTLTPLYGFQGGPNDGAVPTAPVVFGPDGRLYGTTQQGGVNNSCYFYGECGTVFALRPPSSVCKNVSCEWSESVLYLFPGGNMGTPSSGALVFDHAGNFYDTFLWDGSFFCIADSPCGGVYRLSAGSGGWTASNIVPFAFPNEIGAQAAGGVAMDDAGNLYGAVTYPSGAIYQATISGGSWVASVLYNFSFDDGSLPLGGVILDGSGNIYGTTSTGGSGGGGSIYELTPSGGSWNFATLNSIAGGGDLYVGSQANLVMDAAGNLYGTTYADGAHGYGNVFKLTHSNGNWTYTSVYDFTGGSDGGYPVSSVAIDAAGNLYGTASIGGSSVGQCAQGLGCGVVWKIAP